MPEPRQRPGHHYVLTCEFTRRGVMDDAVWYARRRLQWPRFRAYLPDWKT